MEIKTIDDLQKEYPELLAQAVDKAKADAVQAENSRVAALDAIDDPKNAAVHELVLDAKNTGKTADAIKMAVDIIKKHAAPPNPENKGAEWLKSVANDTAASGVNGVQSNPAGEGSEQQELVSAVNFMAGIMNNKKVGVK